MALRKNINIRTGYRTQLKVVCENISNCLKAEDTTQAKLLGLRNNLNSVIGQLNNIDETILGQLNPDKVESDVLESMGILEPTHELLAEVTIKLDKLRVSEVDSVSSTKSNSSTCKLPKFELQVFKGDPLNWQCFWDQFSHSIHENSDLGDIDRFNYLKRYLGGPALEAVSGLTLTSVNYKEAVKILKNRFGNPQVLISTHMETMIKMPRVKGKEDIKGLRKLLNDVENCIRNLNSLELDVSKYGMLLIPLLKDKLPEELNMIIARRFGSEVWKLDKLIEYFDEELTVLENCLSPSKLSSERKRQVPTASSLLAQTGSPKNCLYCDSDDHIASRCKSVTNVNSRKEIIKQKGRCFICLNSGHLARSCPSTYRCNKCNKGRHHVSICDTAKQKSTEQVAHTGYVSSCQSVLLQTAVAKVGCPDKDSLTSSRILFDSGSQRSYITQDLANALSLNPVRKERVMIKTFGKNEASVQTLDVVQLKVQHRFKVSFTYVEALCVPHVCSDLTQQRIDLAKQRYNSIKNLCLADSNDNNLDLKVDVLIGADFYHSFFTGKLRKIVGGPVASETTLGWVLSGRINSKDNDIGILHQNLIETHALRCQTEVVDELKDNLSRFWEIESVTSNKEDSVVNAFEKDIYHNGDRYITKLPFKPDHETLPDNFNVCKKRLESTKRKLKSEGMLKEYDKIFAEYEKENIIERVPRDCVFKESGLVHYLPHRAVVRKDKNTTKIRVVFDASCAVNGPSLNDCLYPGPNLIAKIFDLLLRFRMNKIAIVADIKQAFLNIGIDPQHQDFLRFLWYDVSENSNELIIFKFARVVFGVRSSPFLLNGTIRQHLHKFKETDSEFVTQFSNDLYVDDTVSGCETIEQGKLFHDKAMDILKQAGFTLRKWMSNDCELQEFFDRQCETVPKETEDDSTFADVHIAGAAKADNVNKVLGLEWDKNADEFVFNFSEFISRCKSVVITKRSILSLSASLYDPLGIISPVSAQLKVLFQQLCVDKKDWDELLSEGIKRTWFDFLENLENLGNVRIARFVFCRKESVLSVELHGFCDASVRLYSAVIYIRVITTNGVKIFFLCSKTKVAPLKKLSVPRLEMLACVLLSRLVDSVKSSICDRLIINRIVCWSDSRVSLCWIKGKEKMWRPWIENRAVFVRSVVSRDMWFHVPGTLNPADIPTREVKSFKYVFDSEWVSGPSFLLSEFDYESNEIDYTDLPDAQLEMKTVKIKNVTSTNTVLHHDDNKLDLSQLLQFNHFGSLKKLITVVALVFRFKNNLLSKIGEINVIRSDVITAEEYKLALKYIVLNEQNVMKKDSKFQKLSSSLGLFEDKDGVLRVKGRFANATMTYDEKHPIIIGSADRYFTELVIWDAHEKVCHYGIEATLAEVRSVYWIVRGRKTTKRLLEKCITCKRIQGKTIVPPASPDLPEFRVNHMMNSFQATGLDYAGPLFIRNDCKDSLKVYILLLTCASSRAVHLELVPDMQSSGFLRGFKRFMARHGIPDVVIHDNFKTFRSSDVKLFFTQLQIHQKFILPASPWWGGFYERMVRTVKNALKKILGRSLVTFEELQTVLCDIESIINSRPLFYLSEDEFEPFTPNHLIFGRDISKSSKVLSEPHFAATELLHKRIKYIQTLSNQFWRTFLRTYLNELRQKWSYEKRKAGNALLRVGDLVLIREDIPTPRLQWRMGRVVEVIIGRDGSIRGAKLKTLSKSGQQTFVHRPLQKLIHLEISTPDIKESSNEPLVQEHTTETRKTRKAAIDGQILRRLREQFNN